MRAIDKIYEILESVAGSDSGKGLKEALRKGYPEDEILTLCVRVMAEHMGISRKQFYDLMKASKLYHMHTTYAIASTFYEFMNEEDMESTQTS